MGETMAPLFTWRAAMCDSDLPPTARHIALTLSLHMNELGGSAFPSAVTLARETGLNRATVMRWRAGLEQLGWLRLVRKGGSHAGGRRMASEYEAAIPANYRTAWRDLTDDERRALSDYRPAKQTTGQVARPVTVPDRSGSPTGQVAHHDRSGSPTSTGQVARPQLFNELSIELSTGAQRAAQRSTQPYEDDFAAWYAEYPRRVDKQRAYKAYVAKRRAGADREQLLLSAQRYAARCSRDGTSATYMKMPSTFLNNVWEEHLPGGAADLEDQQTQRRAPGNTTVVTTNNGYRYNLARRNA